MLQKSSCLSQPNSHIASDPLSYCHPELGGTSNLMTWIGLCIGKPWWRGGPDIVLFPYNANVVFLAHISEHPNQQPNHKIQITMGSTEARVDYMGSSILMGIFSNADLKLQDEWKVNLYNTFESSITDKR